MHAEKVAMMKKQVKQEEMKTKKRKKKTWRPTLRLVWGLTNMMMMRKTTHLSSVKMKKKKPHSVFMTRTMKSVCLLPTEKRQKESTGPLPHLQATNDPALLHPQLHLIHREFACLPLLFPTQQESRLIVR
jgi:hypothetical protein